MLPSVDEPVDLRGGGDGERTIDVEGIAAAFGDVGGDCAGNGVDCDLDFWGSAAVLGDADAALKSRAKALLPPPPNASSKAMPWSPADGGDVIWDDETDPNASSNENAFLLSSCGFVTVLVLDEAGTKGEPKSTEVFTGSLEAPFAVGAGGNGEEVEGSSSALAAVKSKLSSNVESS